MSNRVTEKYFNGYNLALREQEILTKIKAKLQLANPKEIFRGRIYDDNKVGSLIYKVKWQGSPAVLKIQGLKLEFDEIDIINKLKLQNKSKKIRLPKLYEGKKWNSRDGYGYILMEYIKAPKIYYPPLASQKEIKEFIDFYKEYRTKVIDKPLFPKHISEQNSLIYTTRRISHWFNIAETKKTIRKKDIKYVEKFISLAGKHLPVIKMDFMHGHFSPYDIYKLSNSEYVIMSNLFWSYRPEYYDTTFHLWASIKALRNLSLSAKKIINYIETWLTGYKKLSFIKSDNNFEKKFNLMLAERCIGAILVDLENQRYIKNRNKHINHLGSIFKKIFNYYTKKL